MNTDGDGNLTSDNAWNYSYDAENRLVGMETNPAAASQAPSLPKLRLAFTYDHRGRRVRKQVYGWDNATNDYSTTPGGGAVFLYDGWNLVAELTLDGSRAQRYVWGPDLSGSLQGAGGIGGLLWITRDYNSCKAVVYDGQGNVMGTVYLGAGRTGNRYEYDPYGRLLTSQETYYGVNCPFRFSTKYTDVETGLAYFGYRYYHPDTGRWINKDPIEEKGGLNLYGYVKNDPISNIDPYGEISFPPGPGLWPPYPPPIPPLPPSYPPTPPDPNIPGFIPIPKWFYHPADEGKPCCCKYKPPSKLTVFKRNDDVGYFSINMKMGYKIEGCYKDDLPLWATCVRVDGTSGVIPECIGNPSCSLTTIPGNYFWPHGSGPHLTWGYLRYLSCENRRWTVKTQMLGITYMWQNWLQGWKGTP